MRTPSIDVEKMSEQTQTVSIAQQIAIGTWLSILTALALVKIIVGFVYIDGGCNGICLLPYYFVAMGVLTLAPAAIAVTTTCSAESTHNLGDMWAFLGRLFFLIIVTGVCGTFYIMSSIVRVSSLDRLCHDSWVPAFAVCVVVADWALFFVFLRLFCSDVGGPDPRPDSRQHMGLYPHDDGSSPFHVWKIQHSRRTL